MLGQGRLQKGDNSVQPGGQFNSAAELCLPHRKPITSRFFFFFFKLFKVISGRYRKDAEFSSGTRTAV